MNSDSVEALLAKLEMDAVEYALKEGGYYLDKRNRRKAKAALLALYEAEAVNVETSTLIEGEVHPLVIKVVPLERIKSLFNV